MMIVLALVYHNMIRAVSIKREQESDWMQQFAKIGITAWAMEGLNGVMNLGQNFTQVVPDILGLLAYGLICFLIAMRFFRFQEKAA